MHFFSISLEKSKEILKKWYGNALESEDDVGDLYATVAATATPKHPPCPPQGGKKGAGGYFSLFTFHSSLFTLHFSLFTPHFSLFTLHFSLL